MVPTLFQLKCFNRFTRANKEIENAEYDVAAADDGDDITWIKGSFTGHDSKKVGSSGSESISIRQLRAERYDYQ